jgi:hypothetical protein
MRGMMLSAFFDELEKIGEQSFKSSRSFGEEEQSTGSLGNTPMKPGEVKQPLTPTQMKPKVINSPSGRGTNYTRSNVEAPGSNVAIVLGAKNAPPPPPRV